MESIAHAIAFLGMNSVRSICLQYLLDASFRTDDPEIKIIFDRLWQASALASELCFKLAKRLELPEPGALVTQVVLSFLGQVASHSLLSRQVVIPILSKGLMERSRIEQESLGLCAAEIGSLLMEQWEVPTGIVARVRAMDMVLLTPCAPKPSEQDCAMALCYFCARLGEKLTRMEIRDLAAFRVEQEQSPELFNFQAYLQQPRLEGLKAVLNEPVLVSSIHTMLHAMHTRL